jgi:hypothetical protein
MTLKLSLYVLPKFSRVPFTIALISLISTMVNGTLLNFGKRYEDDLRIIFDQWPKLHLGFDALSNQKILKGVYYLTFWLSKRRFHKWSCVIDLLFDVYWWYASEANWYPFFGLLGAWDLMKKVMLKASYLLWRWYRQQSLRSRKAGIPKSGSIYPHCAKMKMKGKKLSRCQFHFPGLLEAVLKLKKWKKIFC